MSEELSYPNIYLCGKAGAGKSTVANMLVSEFGYRKAAMADGVKLGIAHLLAEEVPAKQYIRELFPTNKANRKRALEIWEEAQEGWKEKFTAVCGSEHRLVKEHYREFMTWWGTDICRTLDKNVWIDYYIAHTYQFEKPEVCDDVRFQNEEWFFTCNDYVGIHITRDTISTPAPLTSTQAAHVSEQYEPQYAVYTIHNNGDLIQLKLKVREVMEAITNGS